jgi:hypothetical protein
VSILVTIGTRCTTRASPKDYDVVAAEIGGQDWLIGCGHQKLNLSVAANIFSYKGWHGLGTENILDVSGEPRARLTRGKPPISSL